jgi:hypothetical protein
VATAALALTILASVLASEFSDLAENFLENLGAVPIVEADPASWLVVLLLLIFLTMGLIIVVILVFILGDPELALN